MLRRGSFLTGASLPLLADFLAETTRKSPFPRREFRDVPHKEPLTLSVCITCFLLTLSRHQLRRHRVVGRDRRVEVDIQAWRIDGDNQTVTRLSLISCQVLTFLPPTGDRVNGDSIAPRQLCCLTYPPIGMQRAVRSAAFADHPVPCFLGAARTLFWIVPLRFRHPLLEFLQRFTGRPDHIKTQTV